ncbi:MAG: type I 3-dehydroquinate dehydratase [Eubacterium sp.]|nr:type I 3-dehydroquinate dehydratase [Eubacterium sp.]
MRAILERPAICVPINGLVRFAVTQQSRLASESDADMAEWRIDCFAGQESEIPAVARDIKSDLREKKLIATLRTTYEGGEDNGDRFDYFSVIRQLIEQDAADYVDIELERDPGQLKECVKLARDRDIKVIGSYHDFESMPSEEFIIDKLKSAMDIGCDVGKISCMANSVQDAETMLCATGNFFRENPDFPIMTMAMGKHGYKSRLYGGLYGSRVSFATLTKASAPGQRSLEEMKEVFDKLYSRPGHIFLIGFMGTGKSTVAREISEMYDLPEVDTDYLIEEKCGRSVQEIFSEDGEPVFRMIESDLLDELGKWERAVVSCGGGVPLKPLNVRKLQAMGTVVWLTAEAETIYKRVHNSETRPLLNGNMNVDYIRSLMDERRPAYESAADASVATDGRDLADIAREVWEKQVFVF